MSITEHHPAPTSGAELIAESLALKLDREARRIGRTATRDAHKAAGAIGRAHVVLDMLEAYVAGLTEAAEGDITDGPVEADELPGLYL